MENNHESNIRDPEHSLSVCLQFSEHAPHCAG